MATAHTHRLGLPAQRFVWQFFAWAVVLAVPFWAWGALAGGQLLPGLPLAALATFCPAAAGLLMAHRDKVTGAAALFKRSWDMRLGRPLGYILALIIMPAVAAGSFWALRAGGVHVPAPHVSIVSAVVLSAVFFVAAMGEEIGWSGYALGPLQKRYGFVGAALVIGLFGAAYHYIGLVQAHRSLDWIAWWTLYTVAARFVMVWLYNANRKSVVVVALFHAILNASWQLFPVNGSYFDPKTTGIILAVVAVVLMMARAGRQTDATA